MQIERATKEYAHELAYLINLAGEGIPEYLWQSMAEPGETPLSVGAKRAAREEGGFSYTHAKIAIEDNELLGMILAYQLPDPYEMDDLSEYPEVVRPLVILESLAPGSWYINAVTTVEQHRGKGVARQLMLNAEQHAQELGCSQMSLIVSEENHLAKKLYQDLGYSVVAAEPVVGYSNAPHTGHWELMTKTLM